MRRRALQYFLRHCVLYKQGILSPHLRCLKEPEPKVVLREVHEGLCGFTISKSCWPTKYSDMDTIGPPYNKTPPNTYDGVTSAKKLLRSIGSHPRNLDQIENFNKTTNNKVLTLDSDLLEERRKQALLRVVAPRQATTQYYNSRVRIRRFEQGDMVFRKIFLNTKEPGDGSLGPNWHGPYCVLWLRTY